MEIFIRMDDALFFWINNGWSTPILDFVMSFASIAGNAMILAPACVLLILLCDKSHRRKRNVLMFLLTMAVGGAALHAIKQAAPRDRPLQRFDSAIKKGSAIVHTPLNRLYHRSFPSGHSQAAFTAGGFFALYYRKHRWLLYTSAGVVALSRVYLGAHFPSDILAGAALGWLVAWAVWKIDNPAPDCADA